MEQKLSFVFGMMAMLSEERPHNIVIGLNVGVLLESPINKVVPCYIPLPEYLYLFMSERMEK